MAGFKAKPLKLEPLGLSGAAVSGGTVSASSRACNSKIEDSVVSIECGHSGTFIDKSLFSDSTLFGSARSDSSAESERSSSPLSHPVQPPKSPRSASFRRRAPAPTTSLDMIANALRENVPNGIVVILHPGGKLGAEGKLGVGGEGLVQINGPADHAKAFSRGAPSFILVDSSDAPSSALSLLRTRGAQCASAVILVVLASEKPLLAQISDSLKKSMPDLIASGVDDVMFVPTCAAQQLPVTIALSLAKAKACRQHTKNLTELANGYKNQCHNVFWSIAHELVADFPKVKPHLTEVREERVGDVSLQKKLGKGRFGAVYVWERKESIGAVKVMSKREIRSAKEVVKIATEYSILRRLDHPNVVKVQQIVHAMRNMYLFMELAGESNLFQVIQRGRPSGLHWTEASGIFVQIADGLAHCHSMRVAHCDLKPENIQMSADGCAKIVDFGEAVDVAEEVPALEAPVGTIPFMAPEVMCISTTWDPIAADVWSLGVVFMEMLCGNHAFSRLLSWPSQDFSASKAQQLGQDLKMFFAKGETNAHMNALVSITSLCPERPDPLVIQLISGMLDVAAEMRISAADAVQRLNKRAPSLVSTGRLRTGSGSSDC